jgi:hypothetical protein
VFGLARGEIVIVAWIVIAIVSARFWPRVGEWLVRRLSGDDSER